MKCTFNIKHLAAMLLLSGCPVAAFAENTSYYIDSEGGNDQNTGLSEKEAWKTVGRASELRLEAGDKLLLKRGGTYRGILEIKASGSKGNPAFVGTYGRGSKPCVSAPDSSLYAIRVSNSNYIEVDGLEVVNNGSKRMAGRTGVKVECSDYGVSRGITLRALYIHDVNGSLVKQKGGGSALLIENKWSKGGTVSTFDSLAIEDCLIRRCERNAMIWNAPWSRRDWHLSTNVVVRRNVIEQVPGDGIVPIGCKGALVEYNLMRDCPQTLPHTEAAAGFWPWSCDGTVIQFNEVSGHKAPWDGQAYDADYNCRNTVIRYNYSHGNDGGMVLICNAGKGDTIANIGNVNPLVEYNVSIGDGMRTRTTRIGMFSPSIHVAGPVKGAVVRRNIVVSRKKPTTEADRRMVVSDSWEGYADRTTFEENIFCAEEPSSFDMSRSTNNAFHGNRYLWKTQSMEAGAEQKLPPRLFGNGADGAAKAVGKLKNMLKRVRVGDGNFVLTTVDKRKIERFFDENF